MLPPFTKSLLRWYSVHRRTMPWRGTTDPYRIWVSEIILQQTRVEQGWDYYERFVAQFPDVASLAAAPEEEVLRAWQGLGYYTRARNLHAAAATIMTLHGGCFPRTYPEIRALKGVGDYTAAAIASIAFGLPHPVVDGNVLRFLSRYTGMALPVDSPAGKKRILESATGFMDPRQPGEFNQALMEFGALQCVPVNPRCGDCPLRKGCKANTTGRVAELPVKGKKTEVQVRHFNYLVFVTDPGRVDKLWLKKREEKDIWMNFYDFPLIETKKAVSWKQLSAKAGFGFPASPTAPETRYRHLLSHRVIHAAFFVLLIPQGTKLPYKSYSLQEIEKLPLPKLIDRFLRNFLPLHTHSM